MKLVLAARDRALTLTEQRVSLVIKSMRYRF